MPQRPEYHPQVHTGVHLMMVLDALRVTAWWQRGFALGVAAHGIGTSRAFSVNAETGAYASMGMGLHGIVGAVVIPYAVAQWV